MFLCCLILTLLLSPFAASSFHFADSYHGSLAGRTSATKRSTGFTNQGDVRYDNYSLFIKDQRVFLHTGEFHTYRLPVPSLWPDILQKIKAMGMNSISVYLHMGQINPSRGVVDLTGHRALKPLFEAAMEAGLWVVLRPGPYINAETTAGGMPLWITTEVAGFLRSNATDYHDAWQDYIHAIAKEAYGYQISQGGPIVAVQIDNEYAQTGGMGRPEYFEQLMAVYRNAGYDVPLTYNDPGPKRNFINGTGSTDLYGEDGYPQRYNCGAPDEWHPLDLHYHDYHMEVNPWQPYYIPEFQGGSPNGWGPGSPDYQGCYNLTNAAFESIFYKQLWAANAKLISYYMVYGGTSWGGIPWPGVFTSYDWGAAISENRMIFGGKYDELKLQSIFLRSSPSFYKTDWVGNGTTGEVVVSDPKAFGTHLKNPDTNTSYYIVRQLDSTSKEFVSFTLLADRPAGVLPIPQKVPGITLDGRESKVFPINYQFGHSSVLGYTTAEVFFAGVIDGRDVLFLYGDSVYEQEIEVSVTGAHAAVHPSVTVHPDSNSSPPNSAPPSKILTFGQNFTGTIPVYESSTQLILYADKTTILRWYAPMIPADPRTSRFPNFWQVGSNSSVLVGGPLLVRTAKISGSVLSLTGDSDAPTTVYVVAPQHVATVSWNGRTLHKDLTQSRMLSSVGGFVGSLNPSGPPKVAVPKLTNWKFSDSLPEIKPSFDDSKWAVAGHRTTNVPTLPLYGDGRILYGCDYGFCDNQIIWRGHFTASGQETFVNLTINGGQGFAGSVWLNNVFLGTSYGNSTHSTNIIAEVDKKFNFPSKAVVPNQDNVITVVQDHMGFEEGGDNDSKNPRGISGFYLDGGNITTWKVQGKMGGYNKFPDRVRGVVNEGGIFGVRKGWHLPGFDTSHWISRDLSSGLPDNRAGVGFFVTQFDLNVPKGLDVAMSFTFEQELGQTYRALLYVNGWHMGKRIANLGPQFKFPVHEGILDYHGSNTVAIVIWSMEETTVNPKVELTVDAVVEGGIGKVSVNNPSWSPEGRT